MEQISPSSDATPTPAPPSAPLSAAPPSAAPPSAAPPSAAPPSLEPTPLERPSPHGPLPFRRDALVDLMVQRGYVIHEYRLGKHFHFEHRKDRSRSFELRVLGNGSGVPVTLTVSYRLPVGLGHSDASVLRLAHRINAGLLRGRVDVDLDRRFAFATSTLSVQHGFVPGHLDRLLEGLGAELRRCPAVGELAAKGVQA